jgi:hypothetical protein
MAAQLGQILLICQDGWMFDFKKVTGQLFEFGTPDFFKEWIKKLVDKVETVEHEKKLLQQNVDQLDAEIRRFKGLSGKPQFADKTTSLKLI